MPANPSTPEVTRALKPCPNPWCVREEGVEVSRHIVTEKWHVCCDDCMIEGPWADSYDLAITAWNTRTPARGGDELREAFYAESTIANDLLPGTQVVAIDSFMRAVNRIATPEGQFAEIAKNPSRASTDMAGALTADVRRLVIAAREVTDRGTDDAETRELLDAVEAFSSRVPYEDEPDDIAAPQVEGLTSEEHDAPCQRCQGNGEIVTDWERYMHAHPGDTGDEAVADCPDCDGTGRVDEPVEGLTSGEGWQLVPVGDPVTLNECPPGPFAFNRSLGFKTEYGAMSGKDAGAGKVDWTVTHWPDPYCLDSGEAFWGGVSGQEARASLVVQPLAASPKATPPASDAAVPAGAEWPLIQRLRDEEADSVTILCDNPDGPPNAAVECCGFWTGFIERRFEGDTVALALQAAASAKDEAARVGYPDTAAVPKVASDADKASSPVEGLTSGEELTEDKARRLLAQAFEDAGVTGYARHIITGRADWYWTKPAIAAMLATSPKATATASVREDCAAACDLIASESVFVGDSDEGRIRHEGIIAGARNCAAAIRTLTDSGTADTHAGSGEVDVIDLERELFASLVTAAKQSKWMPPEYMMNDWVSDCRDFLINGPDVPVISAGESAKDKAIGLIRDLVIELETWEPELLEVLRLTPQAKLLREWIAKPAALHPVDSRAQGGEKA